MSIDTKRLRERINNDGIVSYMTAKPPFSGTHAMVRFSSISEAESQMLNLLDEIDRLRECWEKSKSLAVKLAIKSETQMDAIKKLREQLARVEERADAWVASGSRSAAIAAHHVRTAINGEPIDHRVPELEDDDERTD